MLRLKKNEHVDWFRITVDLQQQGLSLEAIAKMSEIPRQTLQGWRNKHTNPKLEEALRLIDLWFDMTGKDEDEIPTYDIYKHDGAKWT